MPPENVDTPQEKAWAEKMAEHRRVFLDKDKEAAPRDEASEGGNGTPLLDSARQPSPPPASGSVLTILPPGVSASSSSAAERTAHPELDTGGETVPHFL